MDSILSFTTIAFLLVISPGPNGALIFKTVSTLGTKIALTNIIGLVSATFIHGVLSIFGLSTLIKNIPTLFIFIKTLGALYLFYIGLNAIFNSIKDHRKINHRDEKKSGYTGSNNKIKSRFVEGFLTQILNPKVSIFYLAAFPQFIDFKNPDYIFYSFLLVSIHAAIIFSWFTLFVIIYRKIRSHFTHKGLLVKYTQAFSGFILIYFGVLILYHG
ncbi:MAG: LysE family translocator [Thiohalomonadales bacterium]